LVRSHAAWALGVIGTASAHEALRRACASDGDSAVRAEAEEALGHT